jgi:hypothetical protein
VRDRDAVYGRDFVQRARGLGIEALLTPVRAPRANAIAERLVGTLRRECLDRLIILNETHLGAILDECVRYYNRQRPHRTLALETPEATVRATTGPIRASPVLGGLHHVYERVAARDDPRRGLGGAPLGNRLTPRLLKDEERVPL